MISTKSVFQFSLRLWLWLKSNQRVSGRWWMKSLYKDTYHYITYISTTQALRALALCGEVPNLNGVAP